MERLSTAMQITGIGNSSLGLILALKILPFSPTHPTLGVALKKLIGKFFFSSFGLSQGTSRPPPVTLGETPKKKTTCGGAERAQRYVWPGTESKGGSWNGRTLIFFINFFLNLVWFGVCVISVLPVLVAWGGFVQNPFPNGFRQLGETRIELIKENLCVGNTCITLQV